MDANLVESSTDIDRRLLNDTIDDLRKGGKEVGGIDLRVEEYLGREETFVADVDLVFLRTFVRGAVKE